MNRSTDWEPLAPSDPVPGDPYEVRRLSRELRDVAEAIREQTAAVQRLTDAEHWEGKASATFAATAHKVSARLSEVQGRYDAAVRALDYYAPQLEAEQTVTERLRREAQDLESDHRDAQYRLHQDERDAAATPADQRGPAPARHFVDRDTVAHFSGRLRQLQNEARGAADRVRHAAEAAARYLSDISAHDGLKDGLGDKLKHMAEEAWHAVQAAIKAIAPLLHVIANICKVISAIAGILALLTCWIPGVGELFAAIALVTGAIALVCDLLLMAIGEASLGDVLLDALGVITGGIGKAVSGVAKGVAAATKMEKATELVVRGERLSAEAGQALKAGKLTEAARLSGVAEGKLRQLVGGRLGNLTQQGFMKGGRTVLDGVVKETSIAGKVEHAGGPFKFAFTSFLPDKVHMSDLRHALDVVKAGPQLPSTRAIVDIITHDVSLGQSVRIVGATTIATHDLILGVSAIPDLVDHGGDMFRPQPAEYGKDVYNPADLFELMGQDSGFDLSSLGAHAE